MKDLSRRAKIRVAVFTVLSLLSAAFVTLFACVICRLLTRYFAGYEEVFPGGMEIAEFINFADFKSSLKSLLGILILLTMLLTHFGAILTYVLSAAAGAAVSGALLRGLSLKDETNISAAELKLSGIILIVFSAVQALIAVFIAAVYTVNGGSACGFMCLLLCWQYPLFMWLIYIKKLKELAAV